MKILLIRHGQTPANAERRFLGRTDEPLSREGAVFFQGRVYPEVDRVFVSPMLRCRQTAELIYPRQRHWLVPDLREMDFGLFEGKTNEDLLEQPFYQQWLAAGRADFPQGETMEGFAGRCRQAFVSALAGLEEDKKAAFVVHGGVIMALLACFAGGDFYDYLCGNGQGYLCQWQEGRLLVEARL